MYTHIPEKREYEQFFFSEESLTRLVRVVESFKNPCLLCAPTLGAELEKREKKCRTLDIDTRFSELMSFKYYDISQPISLNENYDVLLCDPPFKFDVRQISEAIDALKSEDTTVIVSWYQSRLDQFLRAFPTLRPVGVTLTYREYDIPFYNQDDAVRFGKVVVQLYSNDPERIRTLWERLA